MGALLYSLLIWGVFFQVTPRVIAWLGQKQASAATSKIQTPTTPDAHP